MEDLIVYREEWYEVSEYQKDTVILKDNLGMEFEILNEDIEIPYAK